MYSEILNRLDEETSLHNLTPRTCKAYRESVLRLLKYTGKDPKELTDDDARAYLLHKQQSGIKARTYNHYHGGIHFFYRYVLRVPWDPDKVPRMKIDTFLPMHGKMNLPSCGKEYFLQPVSRFFFVR